MGMFDDIEVSVSCPKCGKWATCDAQTKDLDSRLSTYRPLSEDWETGSEFGRKFREGLPVYPRFPFDRSHTVWANQAEKIEAQATIPEEFWGKLNFVSVVAICSKCSAFFDGKIKVKNDKLIGGIYDVKERRSDD